MNFLTRLFKQGIAEKINKLFKTTKKKKVKKRKQSKRKINTLPSFIHTYKKNRKVIHAQLTIAIDDRVRLSHLEDIALQLINLNQHLF